MFAFTFILTACSTNQTIKTGVPSDRLSPCPKSPNCVSSLSEDKSPQVDPLTYSATLEEAREKLISVIKSMKRSEIVTAENNYIHATFTSFLFENDHFVTLKVLQNLRSYLSSGYSRGANGHFIPVSDKKDIVESDFLSLFYWKTMNKDLLVFRNFELLPCYLYNCIHDTNVFAVT